MTEYVRFELALHWEHRASAGEQVRVVDAEVHPDLARVDDFWLLDDRVGVRLIYDDARQMTQLQRMTTGEMHMARKTRDAAWAAVTDLAEVDAMAGA